MNRALNHHIESLEMMISYLKRIEARLHEISQEANQSLQLTVDKELDARFITTSLNSLLIHSQEWDNHLRGFRGNGRHLEEMISQCRRTILRDIEDLGGRIRYYEPRFKKYISDNGFEGSHDDLINGFLQCLQQILQIIDESHHRISSISY